MATPHGAAELLSALAALDPRVQPDAGKAIGWAAALHDLPDEILVPAAMDAAAANEYSGLVTVGMVKKAALPYLSRIAREVKSARIRHLIPDDWPDNQPIPELARKQLTREYERTNDYPDQILTSSRQNIDLGSIGHDIP